MIWTVLTGDIVNSSSATPEWLDHVMDTLRKVCAEIETWKTTADRPINIAFARRAGDSWQISIDQPALCLRAALYIQSRLIPIPAQTRIAVATGEGTVPSQPHPDLNSAHGPAFVSSGRLLQTLPKQTLMAHASGGPLDAAFRLADHISRSWTQAQARAIAVMLAPDAGPRQRAADALGISRQAVDQALHAAGFPAIDAALKLIESEAEA